MHQCACAYQIQANYKRWKLAVTAFLTITTFCIASVQEDEIVLVINNLSNPPCHVYKHESSKIVDFKGLFL